MDSSHVEAESRIFFISALNVECVVVPDGLEVKANYDARAINPKQMQRILNQLASFVFNVSRKLPVLR